MIKRFLIRYKYSRFFTSKMVPKVTKKQIFGVFIICTIVAVISFVNFYIDYGTSRNYTSDDPINVIILTYARSGSSLLGELLSSIPNCSYFFEPLAYYCLDLKKCDQNSVHIENLLNCDGNTIKEISKFEKMELVRKVNGFNGTNQMKSVEWSRNCRTDKFHVVKTFLLRMFDIINIIQHRKVPNLRVVHLIRDPRARFFSMSQKDDYRNVTVDKMCQEMESDLHLVQNISTAIYTRIQYENLVANPQQQISDLFNWLYHQNYGNETSEYIATHMGNGSWTPTHDEFKKYYTTYRVTGINPDRWKDGLSTDKITEIEKKCQFVLNEMEYPLLNPN